MSLNGIFNLISIFHCFFLLYRYARVFSEKHFPFISDISETILHHTFFVKKYKYIRLFTNIIVYTEDYHNE